MSASAARLFQPGSAAPAGAYQLAFGHPDPDAFPIELLDIEFLTLEAERSAALSYGPPEGSDQLIEHLRATLLRDEPSGRTVLTHGSMDAIDLTMRVLARRGGLVLAEDPAFPGLATAAGNANVDLVGVPSDAGGLEPDAVVEAVAMASSAGQRVSALYTMPTGSNPTGSVTTATRRERLLEAIVDTDIVIIEDDAYAHLHFDHNTPLPTLHSLMPDRVLSLKTLSKIAFPGIRLAAACGPDDLLDELLSFKPVGGTTPFGSAVISSMLEDFDYDTYVNGLRALYRDRRAIAVEAMSAHIPTAKFTIPAAGFFIWAELPGVDTKRLHQAATKAGVEILPGMAFGIDQTFSSHFRVTYSYEAPERIAEGIAVLGNVINAL